MNRALVFKVAKFAVPLSIASILNMATMFIGMLFVARLGKFELAAAALAVSTFIAMMTVASASMFAVSILVSHKCSRQQHTAAGAVVRHAFVIAIGLSVLVTALLLNADRLLEWFGQDPKLIALTRTYFYYSALSTLPSLISIVIAQFFTGLGMPRFRMISVLVRMPFFIAMSYTFVLGKFGMPTMGLGGLALANFIGMSVNSLAFIACLLLSKKAKRVEIVSLKHGWQLSMFKDIARIGFPIGAQFGGELAAMTVATYILGLFGADALAASQIVSQWSMLVVMVVLGISQALSVLISEAYAQCDYTLVREYYRSCVLVYIIMFVFVACAFLLIPKILIGIFINLHHLDNIPVIYYAKIFFAIASVVLLIDGLRNILSAALRGLHDSATPMYIGIVGLWLISLPCAYILGFTFHDGPIGVRIGFALGIILAVIVLRQRFNNKLQVGLTMAPITQESSASS